MTDKKLTDEDWGLILYRIKKRECTPFLGAGACYGVLPLGAAVAEELAKAESYPLSDRYDLAKVAQFTATMRDPMWPKDVIAERFEKVSSPDFTDLDEPHRVLASLPVEIYLTTNYDDFLLQALRRAEYAAGYFKKPVREVCCWNSNLAKVLAKQPSIFAPRSRFQFSEQQPVVYHLHGHLGLKESMVITEDDYLDFLANLSKPQFQLPHRIERALAGTSLMFIGYSLNDWNFRVVFRNIVSFLERSQSRAHISVQLVPLKADAPPEQKRRAKDYLNRYFSNLNIKVYWGTAREFVKELNIRWQEYQHGK